MDKIEWSEEFSVGVRLLDEQHKKLIRMVNRLIDAHGAAVNSEAVSEALTEMTQYARSHFKDEEQLMLDHGYPEYASQKEQHKAFVKRTVSLCTATSARVEDVPRKTVAYLRDWWTHHILREDMEYRSFFEEKGVR